MVSLPVGVVARPDHTSAPPGTATTVVSAARASVTEDPPSGKEIPPEVMQNLFKESGTATTTPRNSLQKGTLNTSIGLGMVIGFSPLAAQLDAEGKISYGVTQMPTNVGTPVTLGVEDYLMAFKKKGNQEAVRQFLSSQEPG